MNQFTSDADLHRDQWTSSEDRHIASALGRAIRHVRRVALRPHISKDRHEHLNQFVVSLRRELVHLREAGCLSNLQYFAVNAALTKKNHWYDIGEPSNTNSSNLESPNGEPFRYSVSSSDLNRWLRITKYLEINSEAQAYDIETDIREMKLGMDLLEDTLDEIRSINQEGDTLAEQLVTLLACGNGEV